MIPRLSAVFLLVLSIGLADTLTLRSGRTIEGVFLGGDSRQVRLAVGDKIESFDIRDVSGIKFGAPQAAPAPAAAAASPQPVSSTAPRKVEILRPEPAVATTATGASSTVREIPAETAIVIRMIDDVDSERDSVGKTFRASLDEPIMVNGEVVAPRGNDVTVKLVSDEQSGRLTGRTELTLDLVSLQIGDKTVDIDTQVITQASESRTGQSAKVVGGTAALGAIIGAIAGGGRGAAIGAVSGAGAGTAVQVLTKGQKVRIPSETRLQFTLQQPVRL
ncbi:MAG: hypothetical protein HUU41_17295 [Bryobacteraceae bacterium]|nr:hypothetical protein [Bryobacterales bacterium]MEB2362590.1 hypothetical protein [Bryobacterales bacterium]NUN02868.1 hypothetical protein [Bryobacteraceae bacterium]